MIISQTAKTYAKGLIQTAQNGSIDYNTTLQNLEHILEVVNTSTELKTVLCTPTISIEEKISVINDIFNKETSPQILNFLKLLIEKGRFTEFEQIIEAYKFELDEINNIKRVKIISAVELNIDYKKQITSKLGSKLHKEIQPKWQINKDIIGGLIIQIDDNVIDTSIKNKLENLRKIKGNL